MEGGGEKDGGGLGCGDGEEDGMGGGWAVGRAGMRGRIIQYIKLVLGIWGEVLTGWGWCVL